MTWVLMAFDKSTEAFDSEVPLPDSVDEAAVRSLVGDYPNLRGDSFPVEGETLRRLRDEFGVEIRESELDYFIEYRL
jgi:hypothetical protein